MSRSLGVFVGGLAAAFVGIGPATQAAVAAQSWSVQSAPRPVGTTAASFAAVSCPSSSSCTAVGDYAPASGGSLSVTLAEHWDGSSWTIQSTPNPSTHVSRLLAVSCTSATACAAVGYSSDSTAAPLAESWDGTSWTMHGVPLPLTATDGQLNAVSCTSATNCVAAGDYWDSALNQYQPLAVRWDGAHWSQQQVISSSNASTHLNGVSCVSSISCTAVGWTFAASPTCPGSRFIPCAPALTFVARWDGAVWTPQSSPNPGGNNLEGAGFNATSCPSATACTAVGDWGDTGGNRLTLAEQWDGLSWHIQQTPDAAPVNLLSSVSCASVSPCVAVGYTSFNATVGIAERWDGTSWSLLSPLAPSGATIWQLSGVSCSKPNVCTAVGAYTDSGNPANQFPLVELYS